MKRHVCLLPYRAKCAGWVILGTGVLLWAAWILGNGDWDVSLNNIRSLLGMDTIQVDGDPLGLGGFNAETGLASTCTSVLILIGSILAGFSRCKEEDEFTQYLRYRALSVTILGLMVLDLMVVLFFWGASFLIVQNVLVKLSPIFYVVYFHLLVLRERRRHEE